LEQKDRSFAQRETEFKESNELLQVQLHNLQNQLTEERRVLQNHQRELQTARSETTALRERMQELESAGAEAEANAVAEIERFTEQYQLELASLRGDLHQKQLILDERQSKIRTLEEELNSEMRRIEAQLKEQQTLLDRGQLELRKKESEISALREEVSQSEYARKQTETFAATQAEQIRERVKLEVGVLDSQLKEKENALRVMAEGARELESAFDASTADLQTQLAEQQSLIESRETELTALRSQINGLVAQVRDLERTNANALEQQRAADSRVEQELHSQVTELQIQLTEKLAVLGTRNDEIQALESKITGLVKRISQTEVALQHAEASATSEIEQIRRQSQAELVARQAETERKAEALQQREAALYSAEQDRQLEINGLRAEVAEKHSLLQDRNEELLRVKAELDTFQERIAYLESLAKQAELESQQQAEQSGEQTGIELDKLWNELSQREQVLEERQVAVNDLEQNFQAQINSLRSELAEKQALLENPSKGFLLGEPTLTESQKEKLNRLEQLVETIKADNEQTLGSSRNRRWHFSLGRKRRWKS
jgi:chromosome segregation ATPase